MLRHIRRLFDHTKRFVAWPCNTRGTRMGSRIPEPPLPALRILPLSDSQARRHSTVKHPMDSGASPSTSISPIDIQSHLYTSLLEARTADVTLKVNGTWKAVYKLHRVVIIQAVRLTLLLSKSIVHSIRLPGFLPIPIHVRIRGVHPKAWTSSSRSRRT